MPKNLGSSPQGCKFGFLLFQKNGCRHMLPLFEIYFKRISECQKIWVQVLKDVNLGSYYFKKMDVGICSLYLKYILNAFRNAKKFPKKWPAGTSPHSRCAQCNLRKT